jgi:uncharacterized damage-inducible protein DinB
VRLEILHELFHYNDWADAVLFAAAAPLSAEQLDRRFEMGFGSLRATLHHIWGAEQTWLNRWAGVPRERHAAQFDNKTVELPELADWYRSTAAARNDFLASAAAGDGLDQLITYQTMRGDTFTHPLGRLALHVCNHGVHHRAQAINMLRHVGVKPARLDYIFMRLIEPTITPSAEQIARLRDVGFDPKTEPTPAADLAVSDVRLYFAYGDWAQREVLGRARLLDDAALDRPFEMGLGTLRKTLLHIRDAEQWWLENWRSAEACRPPALWEKLAEDTTLDRLASLSDETAAARNALLDRSSGADLQRIVKGCPRPGVELALRMGETMLQLCTHGTHHRAQAVNMLRHLGAEPPALDLALWMRQDASSG